MKKSVQDLAAAVRSVDLASAPKRGLAVLCMSVVAACSTPAPPAPPPPQAKALEPSAPSARPTQALQPIATPTESPMQAFERMRSNVARESVFFDFDKFGIKPDQVSAIADNAKLASTYSTDHLTLQSNCDERGSREYNLALGQRRADAVKGRLVLLGIPEERIETLSFGKEKPQAQCHDETCWSENRRADFCARVEMNRILTEIGS